MFDIIICLFGTYYKDSRIIKKANSLSKRYSVKVISVTRDKPKKRLDYIKDNLVIENIYAGFLKRYYIKYFGFLFWKNLVKKNMAKVYDCNDPDTLLAGYYAKKIWNSKLIYDSHELWSQFFQKHATIIKTAYSFLNSKLMHFYEKLYIKRFDRILAVNKIIKESIKKNYNLNNVYTLFNYVNYMDIKTEVKRQNTIVYFGLFQVGAENYLLSVQKNTDLKPVVIGFDGNHKEIDYKGFLNEKEYTKELLKSKIGFFAFNLQSKNNYFATPNKVFQYLQLNLPVLTVDIPGMISFKKYKFGEFFDPNDEKDLVLKVNKILDNYDYYLNNIKKCKYELSWDNQEKTLLGIYKFNK